MFLRYAGVFCKNNEKSALFFIFNDTNVEFCSWFADFV